MTTYLVIALICTALALLVNAPVVLHARRQRKLAETKLEITRTVNEMNNLMLNGTIKCGEVCHDTVYPIMLSIQHGVRFYATWKFWKPPTEESKKLREAIHEEISKGTPMGQLLNRFARAKSKCFRLHQPIMFYAFSVWVLFVAGGLILFVMALFSALMARLAWRSFREKVSPQKLQQLLGEWSLILSGSPSPQFRHTVW
jgi:hypothetical protein